MENSFNINHDLSPNPKFTVEELKLKIREGLARYIKEGIGRAHEYYPEGKNTQGYCSGQNLLPLAIKEANAINTNDILVTDKIYNYLADLNQLEVFYVLASKEIRDPEWRKFRDHIKKVLRTAPIDYKNKEQIDNFKDLFETISLEHNKKGYGVKMQEKVTFPEKIRRILKYRTPNTTSILDALEPREMVSFARSLLAKWDSNR